MGEQQDRNAGLPDLLEAVCRKPQVKICGLTRVEEALACVELGADAIGCVFYPPSPRHLSDDRAEAICRALPGSVCSVGVFVNEELPTILNKVKRCGLKAVQLHGVESPELVARLLQEGVRVIKSVFINGTPPLDAAESFGASATLVECAGGPLPGGNAMAWDWSEAAGLAARLPTVLAGGLNPETVGRAIAAASPDALDVSSGVEASPGRKDIAKVRLFLEAVAQCLCSRETRRIFQ